ncbi:MAG: hypothetical protein ACM33T_05070 [Solirubrobacterales bacterium]
MSDLGDLVNRSTSFAESWERGYTWTLTTRLGQALEHAEALFGPRDRSWTLLGIEFAASGPAVWYPNRERGYVVIQLQPTAADDAVLGCWQLAHEAVHLLSPVISATFLEEGLATFFQDRFLKSHLPREQAERDFPLTPDYAQARDLVTRLVEVAGNEDLAFARLREARGSGASFTDIAEHHLPRLFPGLDPAIAATLAATFPRR